MTYNDTSLSSGIIQNIERMTDMGSTTISGNATLLKEFTAIVNRIMNRVWHTIFTASDTWQYDDSNNSDMPVSTTNLVSGTKRYALPEEALSVKKLEVLDSTGEEWTELKPLDKKQLVEGVDDFMEDNGTPVYYTLVGNVIELYPAPNYNETNGLKLYLDRASVSFTTSDTIKTPGFASPYHEIVPIKASIEWLKVKQPSSATLALLTQDDIKLEEALKTYYGKRFKSKTPKITRKYESYK